MKKSLMLGISLVWLSAPICWAGELVFGPQKFFAQSQKHVVTFKMANPSGTYWLSVSNGELKIAMQNLVDGGRVFLNGQAVADEADFDHKATKMFGFTKDVTLSTTNTLELQLNGLTGSFVTVEIREADPNPTVSNNRGDLTGANMGDAVVLSWGFDDRAAEYVVFRATSLNGPWIERFRFDKDAAMTSGSKVDTTPDARLMGLCYKLEARNALGQVVLTYEPICVPKFVPEK